MLKAFTLIEIIVALAITSVVSGLAYMSFGNIATSFKKEKLLLSSSFDIQLFQTQLMYEMEMSQGAYLMNNSEFVFEITEEKSITYALFDEFLIRKASNTTTDTIPMKLIVLKGLRLFNSSKPSFPIYALRMSCEIDNEVIPFSLQKEYPAAVLLKYESI